MTDLTHLNALELNLSHERVRLAGAKTKGERDLRTVWVAQLEREIAGERAFLGLAPEETMTLDEIFAELTT